MPVKQLSYDVASKLLEEGDVLLFRGQGFWSYFIKRAGEGKYTHVGVASRVRDQWECVEFREKKGGRAISLDVYAKQNPGMIDVYRPRKSNIYQWFNEETHQVEEERIHFDGYLITNLMRKMTGLPYGWKRIWWIMTRKLPVLRAFYSIDSIIDDRPQDVIYPVCSTTVAYCFNTIGYDLVKHRADEATEPSDIARSSLLSHVFTIK